MMYGRLDCKRRTDPSINIIFEQDTAICSGRAQVAGLTGTASMPVAGLGGVIMRDMTAHHISTASLTACMAEKGYLYKRRSEHEAMCAKPAR